LEKQSGIYPDTLDPEFLQKLLLKREFAESLQSTWKPRSDPCTDDNVFEVTPVQRFVSNWLSPKTPYLSALLFHGVGVGKTCAGIQISEAWLEQYPSNKVFIICPPTIKAGFLRTIFDISKVVIGTKNEPNTASQCTGITYMKLTNTLFERDTEKIQRAVTRLINRRYKIMGYVAFANYIRDLTKHIPASLSQERKDELQYKAIRDEFSHRLVLIDEAHNLRDVMDESKDANDYAGGKSEEEDASGGKILTPRLRLVLEYAEGMKLCLMTATPMYNSYREVIFMLNLLLMNDKKGTLRESDIFDKDGNLLDGSEEILSKISQQYISFMRGENPLSFPIRLFPENVPELPEYPLTNPRRVVIPDEYRTYYRRLPMLHIALQGDALLASEEFTKQLPPGLGLSTMALAKLVQAGNIVFPATQATTGNSAEDYSKRIVGDAIKTVFTKETVDGKAKYRVKDVNPNWLVVGNLAQYSPKFDYLIRHIKQTEGCIFVYTRFIGGGALPLALALEANGYTLYGRRPTEGLFANGVQAPGGRQCALCPRKEQDHGNGGGHDFSPAYYGLLTGDVTLSPRNDLTIAAQRAFGNKDGVQMKIIIGSQIASEGVDLRFIRETHVIDSWFHLNKTEQILGRAIRYLSHCALPKEKRNNTVYLYATYFPPESNLRTRETADQYSYRLGFNKAVTIGKITRIMKKSAIDCNLNRQAIVISGEQSVRQIDGQRKERPNVDINDMPFTAVCDWIETCDYTCSPQIAVGDQKELDDSTYDEYAARWRMDKIRRIFQRLFQEQPFYSSEDIWNMFSNVPRFVMVDLLRSIVDNKTFQVTYKDKTGYIRYCNGYYLFQPNIYMDLTIPLSIRVGRFPVKRDSYFPIEYDMPDVQNEELAINTLSSIEDVWRSMIGWVEQLTNDDEYTPLPDELEQRRLTISQGDKELLDRYRNNVEMIAWFHESFHASNKSPNDRLAFRKTILYYLWDEWLKIDEQLYLIYSSDVAQDPVLLECIRENEYQMGRLLVRRFYHPEHDVVIHLCENGEECKQSVTDAVKRDQMDPINSFKVNPSTTGLLYGFLIAKNKELTFKTGEPAGDGSIGRGLECGNVSNKMDHIRKLIRIGEMLEQSGRGNFDLTNMILVGDVRRAIKGTTRVCTLIDLCLRFLDHIQLRQRRWFFRPLVASITGHSGFFRIGKKR
jgi:hypothetical protein